MQFRFHHGSHRYEEAPIFRKISHTLKADTDQFSCTDHCSTARHASSLLRRLSRTQTLNRFHNLASRLSLSLNPFLNPANHLLRNPAPSLQPETAANARMRQSETSAPVSAA